MCLCYLRKKNAYQIMLLELHSTWLSNHFRIFHFVCVFQKINNSLEMFHPSTYYYQAERKNTGEWTERSALLRHDVNHILNITYLSMQSLPLGDYHSFFPIVGSVFYWGSLSRIPSQIYSLCYRFLSKHFDLYMKFISEIRIYSL